MPATERTFSDSLPARLYLDTDVIIAALVDTQPRYARCKAFIERLATSGHVTICLSSLSWLEFGHAVMRENFRRALPSIRRRRLRPEHWEQPMIRRAYLQALFAELDTLLAQLKWLEIPLTRSVRVAAVRFMADYALGSQDAVHLASAGEVGARDLASLDQKFRRVNGLYLWNDHIHNQAHT